MSSPEELAREKIDKLLTECGWALRNYKAVDVSSARGIALCEVPLKSGRCACLLFHFARQ